ncbi:MAG: serine/threonine protein kinase [Lentisphaeria bacterium]|nr:serine/threonine protein kinase [Lentisphaeria bacterium]
MKHVAVSGDSRERFRDDPVTVSLSAGEVIPPAQMLPSKSVARYRFIRSIGFGGMKTVLLVHDRETNRDVAMALMPDFRKRSSGDIARFCREARVTAQLEHPNIVPVHDFGTDRSGSPFFIMKYLHGQPLSRFLKRVREGAAPEAEEYNINRLIQIFVRVCDAVHFAHSRHVLHLDIKPGNVYLGDYGEVQLIDWGLSADLDPENPPRAEGGIRGTPGFMAPEQIVSGGASLSIQTDIYALGALLFHMLTLQSPLDGAGTKEVLQGTIRGAIPSPEEYTNPCFPVPAALAAVCIKAMAPDPANRYRTALEMKKDVRAFQKGYATSAEDASALRKTALFFNRNALVSFLVMIILLLTAGILYLILR